MRSFRIRVATPSDKPVIRDLMTGSIRANFPKYLSNTEVEAAAESMGMDDTLIADQTYFAVELDGRMAGCGGWGRRATLYGASGTKFHDDRLLDPANEPARIRAFYTHPDFARMGVARLLLEHCENSARDAGFNDVVLGSTVAGRTFYEKNGFTATSTRRHLASNGVEKLTTMMEKSLHKD